MSLKKDDPLGDSLLDESDPVVSEHDIFVNATHYDNTMTLMTLPTTPCTRPRPLHAAESGRWQREQKAFKFELKKAPHQPAVAASAEDVANFKRALVSRRVPLAANYAVGVVCANGDLHLTPCNVAVDLLQDLSHIDESNAQDRLRKEQLTRDDAVELEEAMARDQDGEIAAGRGVGGIHSASNVAASIHQKAAAADTANTAADAEADAATGTTTTTTTAAAAAAESGKSSSRDHTYEHMLQVAGQEPWRPLDVSRKLEVASLQCSQPYQRRDCEHLVPPADIDWYEQASRLLPGTRRTDAWTRPGASQQARSQAALSRLSLVQQVAQIMRQEQTVHFAAIAEKATRVVDDGGLLDALKHVAVMVRGRWIAKSNLVCGGNQVLEAARNYILFMFATASNAAADGGDEVNLARNEEPGVAVQDMADQTSLLVERVYGLVESFAKRRSPGSTVFVLRIDRDRDFLSRHPRVGKMYDEYWPELRDELAATIQQVVRGVSSEVEKNVHFALGVRHDALYELEKNDLSGDTPHEQLLKFLIAMFGHFGVCSWALLLTTLEALKTEHKLASLITADKEWVDELGQVLLLEAIELQPRIYCRRQLGDPQIDPFRDVIVQLFQRKTELKRAEILEELRKRKMEKEKEAAAAAGKPQPAPTNDVDLVILPNTVYARICRELAVVGGAKWVLKDGNGVAD
jgi:hypothetical protein